jgi:hypothetical protein
MARTGRPSRIDAVLERAPDGADITVADRILEAMRRGLPENLAAARAGVLMTTYRAWCIQAARASERLMVNPTTKLTKLDRKLVDFMREVEAAAAEGEAKWLDAMHSLATAGRVTKTERRLDPATIGIPGVTPTVIDAKVTEEERMPSYQAVRWIMEQQYGRRVSVDVRIENGTLDESTMDAELADVLSTWATEHLPEAAPESDVGTNGSNGH